MTRSLAPRTPPEQSVELERRIRRLENATLGVEGAVRLGYATWLTSRASSGVVTVTLQNPYTKGAAVKIADLA